MSNRQSLQQSQPVKRTGRGAQAGCGGTCSSQAAQRAGQKQRGKRGSAEGGSAEGGADRHGLDRGAGELHGAVRGTRHADLSDDLTTTHRVSSAAGRSAGRGKQDRNHCSIGDRPGMHATDMYTAISNSHLSNFPLLH